MPPILLLIVLIGITAGAAGAAALLQKLRRAKLAAIASSWQMRFTPEDAFQLTPRVAARFPTPGAADGLDSHLDRIRQAALSQHR